MPNPLDEARRRLLGSSPSPTPQTAPPLAPPPGGGAVDEARRRLLPNYRPSAPALPSTSAVPIASTQPPPLTSSTVQSGWQYPFAGEYPLTQQFGANPQRYSQFGSPGGVPMANIGVDFGVPSNTQIRPVAPGTVDMVGWDPNGWGNYVRVRHDDGSVTQYSHLSDVGVKQGQPVGYDSWLGASGATGYTWGGANGQPAPHLDFTYYPSGFNRDTAYYGAADPMGFFLDSTQAQPATRPTSTPQTPTTQASPYVAAPQQTRTPVTPQPVAPTARNQQIWQEGAPEWADWLYRFGAGTVDVIADLPKGIAETADRVGDALAGRPQQIDPETQDTALFQAGQWLEDQVAPESSPFYNPQYDEKFTAKLAGGLGSTAGYVAPALLTGPVGVAANAGKIPAILGGIARAVPFVSGALSYSAQLTDQARQAGATPDQIIREQNTGYLLGALEGLLPDELFGGRLITGSAGKLATRLLGELPTSAPLWRRLAAQSLATTGGVLAGGTTEAVQEFLQTVGENYSAQQYSGYDPERALTQGVVDAFTVGGASGAIITALSLLAGVKPNLQTERPAGAQAPATAPEVAQGAQPAQQAQTPVEAPPVAPEAPQSPVAQAEAVDAIAPAPPIRVTNPNPSQLTLTEEAAGQPVSEPLAPTQTVDAPLPDTEPSIQTEPVSAPNAETSAQLPLAEQASGTVTDSPLPPIASVPQTDAEWAQLAAQRAPIQQALTQIAPKLNANPALMPLVRQLEQAASTEKTALDTRNPTLLQQSQTQAEEVVATIEQLQAQPVPPPIQTYPVSNDPRLTEAVQATHDLGGDYIFPDSIESLQAALSGVPTSDNQVLFQYTDTTGQPVQIIRQANGALVANTNGQTVELQPASPATVPTKTPPVAVFIDGNGNIVLGGNGQGRVLLAPNAPGYFDFIHNIYRTGLVIPLPGDPRALRTWRGAIYRAVNVQLEQLTWDLLDLSVPQQLTSRLHYHISNVAPQKMKGLEVLQANWLRRYHRDAFLQFEGIQGNQGAETAIAGPLTNVGKFDAQVQRAIYQAIRNPKNWDDGLSAAWNNRVETFMAENKIPPMPVPSESTDYGVEGSIGNRLSALNSRIETINSDTWNGKNSLNSFERDLVTLAKQVAVDYSGTYIIQMRPINGKKFGDGGQLTVVERPAITLIDARTRTAYAPASAPNAKTEVNTSPREAGAGNISTAYGANPRNQYEMRYRVVDAFEAIASNRPDGSVNPNYLTELQERGRGKVASQDQINRMTTEFYPQELLFDFHVLDRGTPIVGDDLMVESGNGRTMATQNVIRLRPQAYAEYRRLLTERLSDFGLSESDLAGIDHPFLVRERITPVDRVAFAQEANALNKLGMSPWEVARRDSRLIPDAMIDWLDISETGDLFDELLSPKNARVVNAYLDTLSPNVRGEVLSEKGNLNKAGVERIIAAMTARVYNSEAGYGLLKSEFETPIDGGRNLINALFDSFKDVSALEQAVRRGEIDGEYSIHEDIAQAMHTLFLVRTASTSMREVEGYIQLHRRGRDMFESTDPSYVVLTPFQLDVMEFFVNNLRSRSKVDNVLKEWARGILAGAPNLQQMSMFDMGTPITKEEAFYAAQEKITGKTAPTTTRTADNEAGRGDGVQSDAIGTELATDSIGQVGDTRRPDTKQESVRVGPDPVAEPLRTEPEAEVIARQEESLPTAAPLTALQQALAVVDDLMAQEIATDPVTAVLPVPLSKTAFNKVKTHLKNAGLQHDTISNSEGKIEAVAMWREPQQQPAPKTRRRVTPAKPPVPPSVVEIVMPAQVPSGIRGLMENVIGAEETNRALEILRELGREMGGTTGTGPAFSGKVVTLGAELAGIVIRGMTRQFAAYSEIVFSGLREQGIQITQPVKSAVAGWYAAVRTNFLVENNPLASEMDDDATVLRVLRQLEGDTDPIVRTDPSNTRYVDTTTLVSIPLEDIPDFDTTRTDTWHRERLSKEGASNLDTPASVDPQTVTEGVWYKDSKPFAYGHDVYQIQWMDANQLNLKENPMQEGRAEYVLQYEQWLQEGKVPPPVVGTVTPKGAINVGDGNRRSTAARRAGVKIPIAVSDITQGRNGLDTGLTYELALFNAYKAGIPVNLDAMRQVAEAVVASRNAATIKGQAYAYDGIDEMFPDLVEQFSAPPVPIEQVVEQPANPKPSKKGKAENVEILNVGKSALNRYQPNLNAIFENVEGIGEVVYGVGNESTFSIPDERYSEKAFKVAWLWDKSTKRALMVPFDEQGIHYEGMEYYDTEGEIEAYDLSTDFFRTFQKKVMLQDVQLAWQQQQSFFADPDERYMLGGLVDKAFNFIAGTKTVPAQIAENAHADLWGDTLYVNNEAMLLIMAARGRDSTVRGVSYRDVDVPTIISMIRELRVPKSAQPRVDALVYALQRANEVTLPGEGIAIVNMGLPDPAELRDTLILQTRSHEWFHVGQQVLNYQGQHITQNGIEMLSQWQTPTSNWRNIALQLRAKGYPADTRILIEEASAFIAAGQWAELGLSREDAKAFLLQYMRVLEYEYGPDALSVFNHMTDFAQEVRGYASQYRQTSQVSGSLSERRGSRIRPTVRPDVSGIYERYATEPRRRRNRTSAERAVPDFARWFNGSVVTRLGQPLELYATVQADGTRSYSEYIVADTPPSYLAIRNPLRGGAIMSAEQIDRALEYLRVVYGTNPITAQTHTNTVANVEALRVAGNIEGQAFLNALIPTLGRTGAIRLVRGLGYDGLAFGDAWIPFNPEQVRVAERATPAPVPVVEKATRITQQAAQENTKKGWSMSRMANSAFRALHIANTVTTASAVGLLGASSVAIVSAIQQDEALAEALLQMAFNELSSALDSDEWEELTGAWWDDPFWNTLELMGWADRGAQYLYGLTLILNGQNNPNSTDWVTQQASRYSTLSAAEQDAFRKVLYLGFSGDAAMQNAYTGLLDAYQAKGSPLTQLEAAQVLADHTDWVMSFVGETLFSPWNWIGSGLLLGNRGIKGTQELRAANEILTPARVRTTQEAIQRAQAAIASGDGRALLNVMNATGRDGWALTPESKAAWAAHEAMMDAHAYLVGARDETDLWRRLAVWLNPTSDTVRLGQRFLRPRDISDINMATVQKAVERWAADTRVFKPDDYGNRLTLLKAASTRYIADLVKDTVSGLYQSGRASQVVNRVEKISAFQKRALNNLLLRANLGFQATNFMGNVSTQAVDGVLGVGSKSGIQRFWQETVGAMPEFIREGYSKLGIEASDNVETLASMQVYTSIYQHWYPELWNRGLQAMRTPATALTRTQSEDLIRVLKNAWDEGTVRTEVRRWAGRNGIANSREFIREAVEIQRRTANAALAAAHEARGFTLIHYWKKYGWDSAMALIFPYHHWVTRSMMNWTIRLADSPAAFAFYGRYSLAMRDGVNRNEQDPDYLRRNWSFANAGQVRTATRALNNITNGIIPSDLFTVGMEDDERLYLNVIDKLLPLEQVYGLLPNVGFKRDLPEDASPISRFVDTLAQYPAALTPALGIGLAAYRNANGEDSVDAELLDNLVSLPLYAARPLQAATAALGIGGPEGINLDAPYRRMMGLPGNQEYELVRARKFIVDAVQQGLISENDGFNAIATMEGTVWNEALRQATRFYGDRGLVSAFSGFLPRTEPQDEQADWRKGLTEVEELYGSDSPQAEAYRAANPGADVGRVSTRNTFINRTLEDETGEPFTLYSAQEAANRRLVNNLSPYSRNALAPYDERQVATREQYATWARDAYRLLQTPQEKARIQLQAEMYRDRALLFPTFADAQEQYFDLPMEQRKAFLQAHPELQAGWDFETEFRKRHLDLFPLTEQESVEDARPSIGLVLAAVNSGLDQDLIRQMGTSQLSDHLDSYYRDLDQLKAQYPDLDGLYALKGQAEATRTTREFYRSPQGQRLQQYWDAQSALKDSYNRRYQQTGLPQGLNNNAPQLPVSDNDTMSEARRRLLGR